MRLEKEPHLLQKKPKRPVITSPDVVNSYQFWRKSCYTNCLSHIGDFRWNSNGKLTKNGKDIICTGTQQYAPPCIQFKKRLLEKGLFFQDEVSGLAYTPIIFLLTPVRLLLPAPVGTSPTAIFPFQPVLMPIGKLPAAHRADL